MAVKVGDKAIDFTLKDQHNKRLRLSELTRLRLPVPLARQTGANTHRQKGKKILLSFHPLAWTPVCSRQMKSLERKQTKFDKLNTIALGMSVDTVPSKKAWAKSLEIKNTRLLSDFWPHGGVAKLYGIFRAKDGFSERANIIIDEKGKVKFVKVYPLPQLPDIAEIIKVLEG